MENVLISGRGGRNLIECTCRSIFSTTQCSLFCCEKFRKTPKSGVPSVAGGCLFGCFSPIFRVIFGLISVVNACFSARRKIFKKSWSGVLPWNAKGVFLQSRFARLTNGAGRRGCATASAGEAEGKRACSLREWKDVANNSSCFLRASSDSYTKMKKERPGQTNKQKRN